jgi:ATP-dependent Lhr-like helicase
VAEWFTRAFSAPTECQGAAWAAIRSGRHALVAAPTGSGKTLAAFLGALDALVREGLAGPLPDTTRVLYVSPLKALSNDIQRNLERPLMGIGDCLNEQGLPSVGIRTMVRTGDTPAAAREAMRRVPPHILVTTPESLYILLTSDSGRRMLASVESVIVDEIHALANSKRGAHLALSLERLETLTSRDPVRIGLSATQKPVEDVARFLVGARRVDGAGRAQCVVVDTGHVRQRDLALEMPASPLEAVMSGEVWGEVYERLVALIEAHHTTLVFVNTRRLAERVAHALTERLGEAHVTSHHGSLAKEQRLDAEQRLKRGELKALVATASLELGIDIGDVDLVCQLGSPHAISTFLQRVGRSGHAVGGVPKGRLFPLSRDDLVECAALLDAVRREELDRLLIPQAPLDVLAQQVVAACAGEDWCEDALYERVRGAWNYRDLERETFAKCLRMLADGFATRRGRRGAYLHRDAVNARVRARRGARLTAITNGGAIPDNADFDVILEPDGVFLGTLNEDFAIESMPGDIFLLGNNSWRILRVEDGKVRVADANGQPPNIPFWFGEAPGRSDELSTAAIARRPREPSRPSSAPARRNNWSSTWPAHSRSWARCRTATRSCWNDSSTTAAACSWSCIRASAAASTRPGAWRCASVSVARSTSSCKLPRTRTPSSSAWARRTALRSPTPRASCPRRARATCWCRRCSMPRCSACAGAGTPTSRSQYRGFATGARCRRRSSACRRRTW